MSSNTFPDYHNQPLRLRVEEIENPYTVIDEFFQSYHLPDIRFCLHNWLLDSLPKESVESKAHITTYEDIEKLVEACWLIKNKIDDGVHHSMTNSNPINIDDDVLGKSAMLIEKVQSDPLYVINEIFKNNTLTDLRDLIRDWQYVAMSTECSVYDEADQRRQLLLLINELYLFVEALFIFNSENNKEEVPKDELQQISKNQITEPIKVIEEFFNKFPIVYVKRELNDWLDAGISFAGQWPDNFTEGQVLDSYRISLCLVESAQTLILTAK